MDIYQGKSFGIASEGIRGKIGIAVVDFQLAFTDSAFPLGGSALVERAVTNTARLLAIAREKDVPIAACYTAYSTERDMPHWKIGAVRTGFRTDDKGSELDPRIYEKAYDSVFRKSAPSIFFHTGAAPFFTKEGVETVIVTGCNTSGCVRASAVDAFSYGFRVCVPEDCVGDVDAGPHHDNLRDMGRRYADIICADDVIEHLATRYASPAG